MIRSSHRPKIVTLLILFMIIIMITIGVKGLELRQDERGVWHVDVCGGSIIYLNDSLGDTVIWIYWGRYFIGTWTIMADTIPQKPPPPTYTPYPTATPYPTGTPAGQLSARLAKNLPSPIFEHNTPTPYIALRAEGVQLECPSLCSRSSRQVLLSDASRRIFQNKPTF